MSAASIVSWQDADPSQGDLPVALISLHDQVTRRDACVRRGLSETWVSGYWPAKDLRLANREEILNVANLEKLESSIGRKALASEVGCAVSHRAVAEWLSSSIHPMALVFEDDVVPLFEDFEAQTRAVSGALLANARLGGAFICHLGARGDQINLALARRVVTESGNFQSSEQTLWLQNDPDHSLWRAHAYIISKAAADRMLRLEPRAATLADDWGHRRSIGLVDQIFFTTPTIFGQDERIPSTIGPRSESSDRLPVSNSISRHGTFRSSIRLLQKALGSVVRRLRRARSVITSMLPYRIT